MATYQLTMDVGVGPWENGIYFYNQCGEVTLSFTEVFANINALAVFVGFGVSEFYVGGTYSYTITGTVITWTWTWTEDPNTTECGEIAVANSFEFTTKWAAFIPITPTACPTCQEVMIDNCGSVIFEAAVPNGTYEVQVEDHQSGVTYMQDIEFTGSQGTWDQTNTGGVFSPFSVYTVTILDAEGEPVSWIDGANEYNCMRLTFKQFTDTTPA